MTILEINAGDAIARPNEREIARTGPRRMVKLIPTVTGISVPAIWTGPAVIDTIEGQTMLVHQCIVLMYKEPKPQTMLVTVPKEFYEKLPEIPVEW